MRTAKGGEEPLGGRFHHEVTKPFYKKAHHNISNITTIAYNLHGTENLFLQIYFTYIHIKRY